MMDRGRRYCCEGHGLDFGDGVYRCLRHSSAEEQDLVAELDRRARRVGVRPGHHYLDWPYGPNRDVVARRGLVDWAEPRGLRLSRAGKCPRWIRTGRCQPCESRLSNWLEHVTGWTHARAPAVLLAQPYDITTDDEKELRALEDEGFLVNRGRRWYGHGAVSVEVWRPEQAERCGVELD